MMPETRAFVLSHDATDLDCQAEGDPLADVVAALGQAFTVIKERGAPGTGARRRTWLDTFDWRLRNAGLGLEHEQTRRGARLILTATATATEQPAPGWRYRRPVTPADLPAGPIRAAIAKIVEPRALLAAAKAVTVRTTFRLLNADGKTVARLFADRTTVTAGPAVPAPRHDQHASAPVTLPSFLSIAEVRGYPAQARRAATLITALPGARPADRDVFATALDALGHHPGDRNGKVGPPITAQMPAGQAVATVLLDLLGTLTGNVDGVLRDIDTEFLHDLRVSVRRTRAAIKLLGDVLPPELAVHYKTEFKWLGDLTTPVRDLDVHLLGHAGLAASLTAAAPADLEPLRDFLARRRTREFRLLTRGLRSTRFRALVHDWDKALREARDEAVTQAQRATVRRGGPAAQSRRTRRHGKASVLAAERTARAYRVIARRGAAISAQSPPESLHDLRKRCKELRYLLEFFAPLYEPSGYRKVVGDLKQLQDCLGEFQDSQVQREEIVDLAEQMLDERTRPPAATLLALGELAARLAAAQQHARDDFGRRFTRFAGPDGEQRLRALLESLPR
jgi:CHAD domain-containing protein